MSKQRKKVYILNYGLNNIRSLYSAFSYIGANPVVIDKSSSIKKTDYLVLPGVGAFSKGIENLKAMGYYDEILNHNLKNKPLLGICLGMQMMFNESEEFGKHIGLGLIEGKVKKLPNEIKMKLPNVGWYSLEIQNNSWNKLDLDKSSKYYFNHGYYCEPEDNSSVMSISKYGTFKFCSSFKKDSLMGSQFHPEKSSLKGLNFLKIFINN